MAGPGRRTSAAPPRVRSPPRAHLRGTALGITPPAARTSAGPGRVRSPAARAHLRGTALGITGPPRAHLRLPLHANSPVPARTSAVPPRLRSPAPAARTSAVRPPLRAGWPNGARDRRARIGPSAPLWVSPGCPGRSARCTSTIHATTASQCRATPSSPVAIQRRAWSSQGSVVPPGQDQRRVQSGEWIGFIFSSSRRACHGGPTSPRHARRLAPNASRIDIVGTAARSGRSTRSGASRCPTTSSAGRDRRSSRGRSGRSSASTARASTASR
jgi:hypothetical protein